MRVRMKVNITGSRNGEPWPAPGEILDVPELEADDLIGNGYAETVGEGEPDARPTQDAAGDDGPKAAPDDGATTAGDDAQDTPADAGHVKAQPTKPTSRRRKT